jgi:hypothetical protein
MQYVVVVNIPDDYLSDDSIESLCDTVNSAIAEGHKSDSIWVQPLSEVIAS